MSSFFQKWSINEPVPIDILSKVVRELDEQVRNLEDRVLVLEEENIGLSNALYELENSLDARIDILAEHCKNK